VCGRNSFKSAASGLLNTTEPTFCCIDRLSWHDLSEVCSLLLILCRVLLSYLAANEQACGKPMDAE
jgi:hypothetical protein